MKHVLLVFVIDYMTQLQVKKAVRFIRHKVAEGCLNKDEKWNCCNQEFSSLAEMYAHLNGTHASAIDQLSHLLNDVWFIQPDDAIEYIRGSLNIESLTSVLEERRIKAEKVEKFTRRRLEKGTSDKFIVECDCNNQGTVLLFYRYVSVNNPLEEAELQSALCLELNLRGKVRIANEGFNITVGGRKDSIERYRDHMARHPLFADLDLALDKTKRKVFFKPSPGCEHGNCVLIPSIAAYSKYLTTCQ